MSLILYVQILFDQISQVKKGHNSFKNYFKLPLQYTNPLIKQKRQQQKWFHQTAVMICNGMAKTHMQSFEKFTFEM